MTGLERRSGKSNINTNTTNSAEPQKAEPLESFEYREIIAGTTNLDVIKEFGIVHYKYKDCRASDLTSVDHCNIHKDCATAYKEMRAAAKKEGINLRIVSGYRSSTYQKSVFKKKFNNQYPSQQQMRDRLKYSAPSGFSEHHTGLAIDIIDTEERFKNTAEYKWLEKHAIEYGFELSFPDNNAQNLGFEPWHWRYVGKNGEYKTVFEETRRNDPRFKSEYQ